MGPEGAANIIFRAEIAESKNPEETRKQKVAEYTAKFANPYIAAANGHVDAVIGAEETRNYISHSLRLASQKEEKVPNKKHGNPPF